MSYSLKNSLKYSLASVGVLVVTLSTSLPALAQTVPSRTTSSDGTATYMLSNGQQVPATNRDGTAASADAKGGVGYSDGTYVSVNGNGNTVVTSPNGRTTETNTDGHRVNGTIVLARESESSTGEATYTLSNGQQITQTSPSGTVGTRDNKGGVSYDDGTYVSVDGNGNTVVTKDGQLRSVTTADGDRTFSAGGGVPYDGGVSGQKPMDKGAIFGGMQDNLKDGPMGDMKGPMMGGGMDGGKPGGMIYKPGGGKPDNGLGGGKPGGYGIGPGDKPSANNGGKDKPGGKPSSGSGGKKTPSGGSSSSGSGKKQPSGSSSSSGSSGKKTTGSSSSSGSKDTKTSSDTGTKDTGTKDTGTKDTGTEGKGGDKSFGAGTAGGYGSQPAGKTAVDSKLAGMRGESNEPEDTAPGTSGRRDSSGGKTTQPGPGGQEGDGESSGAPRPSAPEGSGPSSTGIWTAPSGTTGPGMVVNPTGVDRNGMPDGNTLEEALEDIEGVTNPR